MASRLTEATIEHHGSIQDLQTFLDPDGNPYVLIATEIPESAKQQPQDGGNGQGGDQDGEQKNQREKQPPDPTMVYVDVDTNKEYKWNSQTRQFEEI